MTLKTGGRPDVGRHGKSLWYPLLWISVLSGIALMFGCGYRDKMPSHFKKIDGRANAFRMLTIEPFGLHAPRERIEVIRVFELKPGTPRLEGNLRWEVMTGVPVLSEGFEVVVGQVPPGFIQVLPPPTETFEPVPGRDYEIRVTMNHPSASPFGAETWWIGE